MSVMFYKTTFMNHTCKHTYEWNQFCYVSSFFQEIFLICIRDVFDLQWLLNLTSIKLLGLKEDLVFCYLGYPVHRLQLADSLLTSEVFIFKHAKKSSV